MTRAGTIPALHEWICLLCELSGSASSFAASDGLDSLQP